MGCCNHYGKDARDWKMKKPATSAGPLGGFAKTRMLFRNYVGLINQVLTGRKKRISIFLRHVATAVAEARKAALSG
jgi:hypothetical protein